MHFPQLKPFILASKSPSRANILKNAGLIFDKIPSNVDEDRLKQEYFTKLVHQPPSIEQFNDLTLQLAKAKGVEVSSRNPDNYVLSADQTLIFENQLISKPNNLYEAKNLILSFSNKEHALINAVTIYRSSQLLWSYGNIVRLKVRKLDLEFVENYINHCGDSVLSSVGAYQLEAFGSHLFENIEGDYYSILGLPLLPLLDKLRDLKVIAS